MPLCDALLAAWGSGRAGKASSNRAARIDTLSESALLLSAIPALVTHASTRLCAPPRYASIILACEIFSSTSTFSYAVTLLGMTKNRKSNGLPVKRDGARMPKDFDPYK
jgi:hypothetical protein